MSCRCCVGGREGPLVAYLFEPSTGASQHNVHGPVATPPKRSAPLPTVLMLIDNSLGFLIGVPPVTAALVCVFPHSCPACYSSMCGWSPSPMSDHDWCSWSGTVLRESSSNELAPSLGCTYRSLGVLGLIPPGLEGASSVRSSWGLITYFYQQISRFPPIIIEIAQLPPTKFTNICTIPSPPHHVPNAISWWILVQKTWSRAYFKALNKLFIFLYVDLNTVII